jgi:hypothetical protein
MGTVSLDDFRSYVHIKAYDVISSGNFKRHLSSCRENGDKWAIQMYNGQTSVQNKIRDLFSLVAQLTPPSCAMVHRVCKDVMSCAQPPVKVLTGYNVCCLTGVSVEHCIDLTRVGKNPKEVYVHPRFRHFFMLLWYCAKVEYVIRACTKQWMDTQESKQCPENYTQICEDYSQQNGEFTDQLYALFMKASEYVTASLVLYREKCALRPALTASKEYLEEKDENGQNNRPEKDTN